MTAAEILQKWGEYTDFDPDRKSFNLLSNDWQLHRCNEKIVKVQNEFDSSGIISVLFAKQMFQSLVKTTNVSLEDIVLHPDQIEETKEMWSMFYSEEMKSLEDNFLNGLDSFLRTTSGKKLLGDNEDTGRQVVLDAVDSVVEDLIKCNEDLFVRGGKFLPVTKFSTRVHVFNSLADCLITLENSDDGIYICYVSVANSIDGYFGIYLKSNGNLISVNGRANEAYIGAHSRSRNNRRIEEKKFNLFPYNEMINFFGSDYKGYATSTEIDSEKLEIMNLAPDRYFTLVIAASLLNHKYVEKQLDSYEIKYVDSLLPQNTWMLSEDSRALVVQGESALLQAHENFHLNSNFTSENVVSGELSSSFHWKNNPKHYSATGCFPTGANQIMVDLWADGFVLDTSKLMQVTPNLKLLEGEESVTVNQEYVGGQDRIELEAYRQSRMQLAQYMRGRIYEEYVRCGGVEAIRKWWDGEIVEHLDSIYDYICRSVIANEAGELEYVTPGWYRESEGLLNAIARVDGLYPSGVVGRKLNETREYRTYSDGMYKCPITGNVANVFFGFDIRSWRDMEELIGHEVPKILKGYLKNGHRNSGNSILSSCDAVETVGTPFEGLESQNSIYNNGKTVAYYGASHEIFSFTIGLSKRGLNRIVKEYKENHPKGETSDV